MRGFCDGKVSSKDRCTHAASNPKKSSVTGFWFFDHFASTVTAFTSSNDLTGGTLSVGSTFFLLTPTALHVHLTRTKYRCGRRKKPSQQRSKGVGSRSVERHSNQQLVYAVSPWLAAPAKIVRERPDRAGPCQCGCAMGKKADRPDQQSTTQGRERKNPNPKHRFVLQAAA